MAIVMIMTTMSRAVFLWRASSFHLLSCADTDIEDKCFVSHGECLFLI